jgi:hypothetical protein
VQKGIVRGSFSLGTGLRDVNGTICSALFTRAMSPYTEAPASCAYGWSGVRRWPSGQLTPAVATHDFSKELM